MHRKPLSRYMLLRMAICESLKKSVEDCIDKAKELKYSIVDINLVLTFLTDLLPDQKFDLILGKIVYYNLIINTKKWRVFSQNFFYLK